MFLLEKNCFTPNYLFLRNSSVYDRITLDRLVALGRWKYFIRNIASVEGLHKGSQLEWCTPSEESSKHSLKIWGQWRHSIHCFHMNENHWWRFCFCYIFEGKIIVQLLCEFSLLFNIFQWGIHWVIIKLLR